ncbi:MAG: hypothetical protein JNM14_13465 [Ferruginibacter sp.]|nr:hypothetical protein [Ferruginibacter sp.]
MKFFLSILLLCPLLLAAQNKAHRFEKDTLYTSSGFKIYEGQTLQIGKRPNNITGFRFISKLNIDPKSLENNSVIVKELSDYGYSPTGSAKIDVKAAIVFRDGSTGFVTFDLAFDHAIGTRLPGTTSELILPKEYLISKEQAIAMHKPAFENDTLFTSCGFKIYKGQYLEIGQTTGFAGRFRYLNILTPVDHGILEKERVLVLDISGFGFTLQGNGFAYIAVELARKNKRPKGLEMHLSFDQAIENIPGIPSELVVPDGFRGILKKDPLTELERIENLYHSKIITKAELDAATKKLAAQEKEL